MRLVVGGQIEKQKIADALTALVGERAESITIMGDIDAAMALKAGVADYYFGACNTGGGGALAMAIAIAGAEPCITVGMPGKILSEAEIMAAVQQGKKAFGFTGQDVDVVLPMLVNALLT